VQVELPLGHERTLNGLWSAARAGRLGHALLLAGPSGIGKWSVAQALALGLLCQSGPGPACGACGSCRRALAAGAAGSHPDLFLLDAVELELETIPIDWFAPRDSSPPERVDSFLALKSAERGWRPVLIREAERMSEAAQNALLKRLEEPALGDLFVLVSAHPSRLLPTIHSRCVRVACAALAPELAIRVASAHGLAPELAAELARWSAGSPGGMLELEREGAPQWRALWSALLAGELDAAQAAAQARAIEGEYAGKTPAARERARARRGLELALELLADALRVGAGAALEPLRHGDLGEVLRDCAPARSPALGGWMFEELLDIARELERNLPPETLLVRAALVMARNAPAGAARLRTSDSGPLRSGARPAASAALQPAARRARAKAGAGASKAAPETEGEDEGSEEAP
jgi:hypothetical protein